jgi:hypothetical protein
MVDSPALGFLPAVEGFTSFCCGRCTVKRGFFKAAVICVLVSLVAACDKAESEFKKAQMDEQYQYMDGALKKYVEIVKNYRDSEAARLSMDRIFGIVSEKTRDFTAIDEKSRETMDYFAANFPDSRLGAAAKRIAEKERIRGEISGRYGKLFEKLTIEDYTGIEGYFPGSKVNEELVEKLARRDARNGMVVQGFRLVDVIPEGNDRAGLVTARQEYYPENGSTGEIKYLLHLSRDGGTWVVLSMEMAPVHSLKAR